MSLIDGAGDGAPCTISCASISIAAAALIAYIPLLIVLLFAWYVVGHLL